MYREKVIPVVIVIVATIKAALSYDFNSFAFTVLLSIFGIWFVWFSDAIGSAMPWALFRSQEYSGNKPSTGPVIWVTGWILLVMAMIWKSLKNFILQ